MISLVCISVYFGYQNNITLGKMDARYYDDTYQASSMVLANLEKNDICDTQDILSFLEDKPAGKTDLKRGVLEDEVYNKLYMVYGDLARNAKIALSY